MRWLVLFLLLVARAEASITMMSSFDVVDTDTGTATDSLDFATTETATDADIRPSTTRAHQANTGGTDSSARSGYVVVTSGETAYWSKPTTVSLSASWVSASASLNLVSIPSGELRIFEFREGSNLGCNWRIQSDGKIKAYYDTTLLHTSVDAMGLRHCTGASNSWIPCSADADCQPDIATCAACSGGAGCYWAELEFQQVNASGSQPRVSCDLWWYGRQQWTSTFDTISRTPAAVTDFRLGAPGGEAFNLEAYFDDFVLGVDQRVGHGFVGFGVPASDGTGNSFILQNCVGGLLLHDCEDDYAFGGVAGSTSGDDTIRARIVNKVASIATTTLPSLSEFSGLAIPAVEWVTVGRTTGNDTGTATISQVTQQCDGTGCVAEVPAHSWNITYTVPTVAQLGRIMTPNPPRGGLGWTYAGLQQMGTRLQTTTMPAGNTDLRLTAMGMHVRGQKPDLQETVVLSDHNAGTNDGLRTICMPGDSLASGTATVNCDNNPAIACSQESYCSWDAFPTGQQDKPSGGCDTDTECRTCTGRRSEYNRAAGYPCTSNTNCPSVAGVGECNLTDNVCTSNAFVQCTADADCGSLGGVCDTTATCADACPGGSCPETSTLGSWAASLVGKVSADNIIVCGQGSETIYQMVENRFTDIANGAQQNCYAAKGSGACTCSSSGDCGGGTCAGGVCTTGASAVCTIGSACTTGICKFAPCDYLIPMEGANDLLAIYPNAECANAIQPRDLDNTQSGVCRDNCSAAQIAITCTNDSQCAGISASSRCIGATKQSESSTQGWACRAARGDVASGTNANCSIQEAPSTPAIVNDKVLHGCNADSQCAGAGATCTLNDSSKRGFGMCQCASDAGCTTAYGAGFKCIGAQCRRSCTVDTDCSSGPTRTGSCVNVSGTLVCAGRCTCPCDARTCSTNGDCVWTTRKSPGGLWKFQNRGQCVAGKCSQCGPEICERDSATTYAFKNSASQLGAQTYVGYIDEMKRQLAVLPDSGDGRPLLIYVGQMDYPTADWTCLHVGPYYADWGMLRRAEAILLKRGEHIIPIRTDLGQYRRMGSQWSDLKPPLPGSTVWQPGEDPVHNAGDFTGVHLSIFGANIISDHIAAYLNTLGSCAVGTGVNAVAQRYCKKVAGGYATTGECPNATDPITCACTTDVQCGSRQTCALRKCTTGADCPGSGDGCNAE